MIQLLLNVLRIMKNQLEYRKNFISMYCVRHTILVLFFFKVRYYLLDPPKIITSIRTLPSSKSVDVFIECSSIANPTPTISWFDDNQQEINNYQLYTIKQINQTSILSFTVYSKEHSKVLYYCRSNNSVGTVEKLINISGK